MLWARPVMGNIKIPPRLILRRTGQPQLCTGEGGQTLKFMQMISSDIRTTVRIDIHILILRGLERVRYA
jgi:hypothetical protein